MFYILVLAYVLGGLTLIPIVITSLLVLVYYSSPVASSPAPESAADPAHSGSGPRKEDGDADLPKIYRAGWLTVRQTYEAPTTSDGSYIGLLASGYRNFMDQRSKDPKKARLKDQYYTVLKQNVLFLYTDEDQLDCAAAIGVTLYDVILYPRACPDGELFVKRRAICLNPPSQPHLSDQAPAKDKKDQAADGCPSDRKVAGHPQPWFIFTKTNSEKEDWYHVLVASSKLSGPSPKAAFARDASLFVAEDMAKLVDGIDQQPDPIPMRWMNAMLGRLFLSAYRTQALESWIINRIVKKLAKVQTPAFLSAIHVREVNVGSATPFFSKPMLKELTIDGDASMEVHVNYMGEFRVTIETEATINLSSRFRPYVVDLVLAVVLKELEGNLILKIKKPPSNRLWFGFTTMPRLDFELEPVVSNRQIKWAMVLKSIESRLREVVQESIVLPHLDDLVFFDSLPYARPGGIWGDAARKMAEGGGSSAEHMSDTAHSGDELKEKAVEKPSAPEPPLNQPDGSAADSSARDSNKALPETLRQRSTTKVENDLINLSEHDSAHSKGANSSSTHSLSATQDSKRNNWFGTTNRRADSGPSLAPSHSLSRKGGKREPTYVSSGFDAEAISRLKEALPSRTEENQGVSMSAKHNSGTYVADLPIFTAESLQCTTPEAEYSSLGPSTSTVPVPAKTAPSDWLDSSDADDRLDEEHQVGATTGRTPRLRSSNASNEVCSSEPPLRQLPPPIAAHRQLHPPSTLIPPQRLATTSPRSGSDSSPLSPSPSILAQLRTRAADKETLAASVTQARDVVKKWGASWATKRRSTLVTPNQPYTNGFNPISIDENSESSTLEDSLPEPSTEQIEVTDPKGLATAQPTDSSSASGPVEKPENDLAEGDEASTSGGGVPASSKLKSPGSTSTGKVPSSQAVHDGSAPSSSLVPAQDDPAVKRNRIVSSNGHFIPAAPLSTTGLSISSAQLSTAASSPGRMANTFLCERSPTQIALSPRPTCPPSLSERSSYKPVPMMAIPGIKDSSHRFGLGSDSLPPLSETVESQSRGGSAYSHEQSENTSPLLLSVHNGAKDMPSNLASGSQTATPQSDLEEAPKNQEGSSSCLTDSRGSGVEPQSDEPEDVDRLQNNQVSSIKTERVRNAPSTEINATEDVDTPSFSSSIDEAWGL